MEGVRRNILGKLIAQGSIFGWIVTGPLPEPNLKRLSNYVSGYAKIVVSGRFEGSLKPSGRAHKVLPNKRKSHSNGMDKSVGCLGDVKVGETAAIREGIESNTKWHSKVPFGWNNYKVDWKSCNSSNELNILKNNFSS